MELEEKKEGIGEFFKKIKGVGLGDLAVFCRQFSTMINSGLSLVRSLEILAQQTSNYKLKEATISVQDNVESGMSLSKALKQESDIFPQLFTSMVEAGETGGLLGESLEEMADHFENENDLKQKVTSALAYPAVISFVAIGVVAFLVIGILPTFVNMFNDMDVTLPLPTKILLNLSGFLSGVGGIAVLGIILAAMLALYRYYKTEQGERLIDGLLLKTPLIGDLITKIAVARFTSTLAVLIESGVSIIDSLDVVSRIMTNRIIADRVTEARESISEGESIADPLAANGIFPQMVLQMIRVGEETGALAQMLEKVTYFYNREVEHRIETVVSLIEPALIVVLGLVVGGIVISIMLPMFNMIGSI
ncbi:type II secretion system F family protein [Halanaerobacter jeridensis]|uniref:Type IV pilus assembly protein PilC n=1 Tax=Halanaerobacter jeridensis TaxID=706427 RepID=A0A938XUD6_9FIRM|nr:type II secretion system F family protein [Halanaerobacter jeridensis]MBM7557956.1 type IV pilus assembly protein PilC [Halanaerobacter jeridensis]